MGKNATYTSECMVQEFLSVLGDRIEVDQLSELSASPFFSLMADESTNIAVLKELVLNGKPKSVFINIKYLFTV